jgi:hypothetical protein
MLQVLRENYLYAKLLKCDFFKSQVTYLRFIVGSNRIKIDLTKIKIIIE